MNAQVKENITPAELIASANARITQGLKYGADMQSSADLCFSDATLLIELALDKDEAYEVALRALVWLWAGADIDEFLCGTDENFLASDFEVIGECL